MYWLIPIGLGALVAGCMSEEEQPPQPPSPPTPDGPCGTQCRPLRRHQDVPRLLRENRHDNFTFSAMLGDQTSSIFIHVDQRVEANHAELARYVFNQSRYCAHPMLQSLGLPNPSREYHVFITPSTYQTDDGMVSFVQQTGEIIFNSQGFPRTFSDEARCVDSHIAHEWGHRIRELKAIFPPVISYEGYSRMLEEGMATYLSREFSTLPPPVPVNVERQSTLNLQAIRAASEDWQRCREENQYSEESLQSCGASQAGISGPEVSFQIAGDDGTLYQARSSLFYYLENRLVAPMRHGEFLILGARTTYELSGGSSTYRDYVSFDLSENTCADLLPLSYRERSPFKSACVVPNNLSSPTSANVYFLRETVSGGYVDVECEESGRRAITYFQLPQDHVGRYSSFSTYADNVSRPQFSRWNYEDGMCFWREIESRYGQRRFNQIVHQTQRIGEETRMCLPVNFAQMFATAAGVDLAEMTQIFSKYFSRPEIYTTQYLPPVCR